MGIMQPLNTVIRNRIARRPPLVGVCPCCDRHLDEPYIELTIMFGKYLGLAPEFSLNYPAGNFEKIWIMLEDLEEQGALKQLPPHFAVALAGMAFWTSVSGESALAKGACWVRSGSWLNDSFSEEAAKATLHDLFMKYFPRLSEGSDKPNPDLFFLPRGHPSRPGARSSR